MIHKVTKTLNIRITYMFNSVNNICVENDVKINQID